MMMHFCQCSWRAVIAIATLGIVATACRGGGTEVREQPLPAALLNISGTGQRGSAGIPLKQPLVVQVVDEVGRGVAGVRVRWEIQAGGGVFSPPVSTSDADGTARTTWVPEGTAGSYVARAVLLSAPSLTATFTAEVGPGTATKLRIDPDHVLALPKTPMALKVAAFDGYGNSIPKPAVEWTSLHPDVVVVDSAGVFVGSKLGTALIVARLSSLADTARVQVGMPAA